MTDFLNSIRARIIFHKYALIAMCMVSLVYGLPQIMARSALGNSYQGIPYLVNDSEGEYASRIHEILDGYYSVGSPIFYEYKDSFALIPPTGELIFYALPAYATGLSVGSVIEITRFIFPALVFFFTYLFLYSISTRKGRGAIISAIAGGLLITIGAGIVDYRGFISYLIHGGNAPALLWLSRSVNPVTGMLLLSSLLILLWNLFSRKGRWPMIATAMLVLAIMSGYAFSFAIGLTISSLLVFYFLWQKDWKSGLRMALVPIGSLVLNGIYIIHSLSAVKGGSATSDPLKSGLFLTHVPTLNIVSILTLIVFAVFFAYFYTCDRKEINSSGNINESSLLWWWFGLCVLLSCVTVYFQQIITGLAVWPQHFAQYTVPLCMIVGMMLLENVIRKRSKQLWAIAIGIILLVSLIQGFRSITTVSGTLPQYRDQQTWAPVFDWLNQHAPKDCVVYVSSDYGNEINRFIPGFTSCNDYHSFYIYNGVSFDRIIHNFLVNLRLRGVKQSDIAQHFKDNWFWTQAYFFRDWGDMFCCVDPWLAKFKSRAEINDYFAAMEKDIEKRYTVYLKGDLLSELKRYRLDYFVVETDKQPQVNPKNFPFLHPEAQFGRFAIYSISSSTPK